MLFRSTETRKYVTRPWFSELTPEVLTLNILPPDALSMQTLYGYINFLEQRNSDTASYELAFWEKILQPFAILGLVLVGISFVFGPLRQATVGFRIFVGVLFGISFRLVQDIVGPLSIVFELPPLMAILLPIVL